MLEPTNNKIAGNNSNNSTTTPTKPVEITQNDLLFDLKPNEISSYSAYASAESSPTQGNSLIQTSSSSTVLIKQKNSNESSSSSLSSYLTMENNSKLMDDLLFATAPSGLQTGQIDGRETPNNASTKTPTESFFEDDQTSCRIVILITIY